MATTNVPPIEITAAGVVAPSPDAVLVGVQGDINAAFGSNLNYQLTTPQGQLAMSEAAVISNNYATFQYYVQQVDPAYASGRMQDAIARIYFLERNPAVPTTLQIACLGAQGVIIPIGALIRDDAGNQFQCAEQGTIPVTGSITLEFDCTVPGPTAVPSANGVTIYQAISGWDSAAVVSGAVGRNVESRSAFEARRADSVAGNSFGPIGAIIGAVAKVANVIDYFGYNNSTAAPVTFAGVSIPANSIYISVSGGTRADIAQAILSKKAAGAPMAGNTPVTAYDNNPLYAAPIPYQITFTIPTPLQLLWKVTLVNGPLIPSDAVAQVQAALIAAATGESDVVPPPPRARIGSSVYAPNYVSAINALGAWAQVASILIGSNNSPSAVFQATIIGTVMTVTSVASGTIAVGQTLTDALGELANGTQIVSLGTGSGGTGTYNITSPGGTLGGASFTGTGSGTNLTASAVTGTIEIGATISGTGVPVGTTIVSQTSGTPGGAGVYVTSVATTAAAAAIVTRVAMSTAVAGSTSQNVNADQIPQITAPNISVVTT